MSGLAGFKAGQEESALRRGRCGRRAGGPADLANGYQTGQDSR